MHFARNLRKLREAKGLNQEELGKILHLEQTTISSYERGVSQPPLATLTKMADYFDVSIDELIGRNRKNSTIIYEEVTTFNKHHFVNETAEEIGEKARQYIIQIIEETKNGNIS